MGYLDRLKKIDQTICDQGDFPHERQMRNHQNLQNLGKGGFDGFDGKSYSVREEKNAATEATTPATRSSAWVLHYPDREPLEVWFSPAADHAEALSTYPDAVAAEPLHEVRKPVRTETSIFDSSAHAPEHSARACEPGCSTCRHRKRPGLSAGYCGGGRDDLPGAYGLHHPLKKLPDDSGVSCASYRPHEG